MRKITYFFITLVVIFIALTLISNAGEFSKEQENELMSAREWKLAFDEKYPDTLILNDTTYDFMFDEIEKGISGLGYQENQYYIIAAIEDSVATFLFFIQMQNVKAQWVGEFTFPYKAGINA